METGDNENILDRIKDEKLKAEINDIIEQSELDTRRNIKIRHKLYRIFLFAYALVGVCLIMMVVFLFNNGDLIFSDAKFLNKEDLKKEINAVIEHGGDIDIVKHVFERKVRVSKPILNQSEFLQKHYPEDVTIAFVLEDIRADYFKTNTPNDSSVYLSKLNEIIAENNITNPFDKLEDPQKYNFENIKSKLDSNYVLIQSDINKVTDELNIKNQLVGRYLSRSELSYKISIIALILTILLSCYQIYQSFRSEHRVTETIKKSRQICHSPFASKNKYTKKENGIEKNYICTHSDAINEELEKRGYKLVQKDIPQYREPDDQ